MTFTEQENNRGESGFKGGIMSIGLALVRLRCLWNLPLEVTR